MDLQLIADEIVSALEPRLGEGKVADYIPELARVDPKQTPTRRFQSRAFPRSSC
jgi:glutaminase